MRGVRNKEQSLSINSSSQKCNKPCSSRCANTIRSANIPPFFELINITAPKSSEIFLKKETLSEFQS